MDHCFIDQHLSLVTPAEWKITSVILRWTEGTGKRSVKLSLSEFEELTGMSRSTVCKAIKRVLKRGLIQRTGVRAGKRLGFYYRFVEPASALAERPQTQKRFPFVLVG